MFRPSIALLSLLIALASAARAELAPPDVSLEAHSSAVLALAFSPDGKRLASLGDDGLLKIWDLSTRKPLLVVNDLRNNRNQLRFTPDAKLLLAIGSSSDVRIVDVEAGNERPAIHLANFSGPANCIDLSPDGKTVAVAGRAMLRIYDLATSKEAATYEIHKGYSVNCVVYSADGAVLATAGSDRNGLVLDAKTGKTLQTFQLPLQGLALALSRDGKTLFAACDDRSLNSYEVGGRESRLILRKGVPVLALAVAPDGKCLYVGGPGHSPWAVKLPEQDLVELTLDSHDWVKSVAVSPDGTLLAGGGNGGSVYLWKLAR